MRQFTDYEHINWDALERFLKESISDLPKEQMDVKKFSEGYSNLTYLITFGDWEGVLRRPPFGEIPPKAHDMSREYNILRKVNNAFPLAPKPYLYSEDPNIMGRHFYVMEKKQGIVIDEKIPEYFGNVEKIGPLISTNLINTLIEMQSIDYKEANLTDIGKPEGYLERQVHGWIKRYNRSRTDNTPEAEELEAWFKDNIPISREIAIVHNDFKLNNLVLDNDIPGKVNGVLDWELSTVGDPMTDLGSTVAYWRQSGDPDLGINVVTNQPGFFNRREFVEEYASRCQRDMSDITYYVAFGFYKLAAILQQIYYRWAKGEIEDDRFETLNEAVGNLIEMAHLTKSNRII
ncbi:phosphotransferase family protein [Thalassobacillus devorans]|uniref:Phosphotransferase family protein n=1 Tax=Thalassobacillus devorans TaxID=279813 RepID=A0ABQ1P5D2_9BACI|nr:phosphotransferase family protein [Thalassobacillus devorans]NIK28032.1 aminoglycoside phosphotransferase (APT) family kinase protein [Thalassobacillus devorans]GGC89438.1 phosphotransferase family protein [Thalassobacillus devorans]